MFMNKESLQNYLIENSPDSHTLILLELKKTFQHQQRRTEVKT